MTLPSSADLLNFEKLLSLTLLRIVYFLGLLGICLAVLFAAFGALGVMRYSFATGTGTLVFAIVSGAMGVLVWRVICELWTVLFGIYDRLGQIKDQLNTRPSP
jgi:Domain of unknown function (DUF4282)